MRILVVMGVLVALGGALVLYMSQEFTECFATFRTDASAERGAGTMRDAGHDADVDDGTVTFSSGETGDDARDFRERFAAVVRDERAELAHAGNGCVERPFFN